MYDHPGIDYNNVYLKDFENVDKFEQDSLNRQSQPRMPWHDIALQIRGATVQDMVRHFT